MKTEVAIIGGGPAGLLLSQLLNRAGVSTIILERATREHVLARIRAGVLERGSVELLGEAGVGGRVGQEGIAHDACLITDKDLTVRINFKEFTGKPVIVFGQTEVTAELYAAQDAMGATILHEVGNVSIEGAETARPIVSFDHGGNRKQIECLFVAGCDGFHGVSRRSIPAERRREFERVYPFGWLGLLSRTPPAHHEMIYACSDEGFALASMRNRMLSRYYVQVPLDARAENWSDDDFWDALRLRLPAGVVDRMVTGPSIEKSIAPMRSFVSEPMRWGRLLLAGDAAHIVPPTGAKGLNLAFSDVFYLHQALIDAIRHGREGGLDAYSDRALDRVWKAMRFSWQMTTMLHRFEDEDGFAPQMRKASLRHLAESETARRDLAENYVGLPY